MRARSFPRLTARSVRIAPVVGALGVLVPAIARTQQEPAPTRCDTIVSRSTAAPLEGAHLRTLRFDPVAAGAHAGVPSVIGRLHATTRASTVARDVHITSDGIIDTIAVGETMRRLRQRPYIADAMIVATRCGSDADVTVATTDRWTLQPTLSAQSSSSYGGLEERDLLGTGRTASILVASRRGKLGGAVGYTDPFLFDLPIYARLRAARFPDGGEMRARVRNAEQSVFDRWRVQLTVAQYRQDTRHTEKFGGVSVLTSQAFQRNAAFLVVGRRIAADASSVTSLLGGFDLERASLNAPDDALTVGPKLVERRYHGLSTGLGRRAVAYDTVSWVAGRALLDVPRGVEYEGMIGAGREDVARRGAGFGSLWLGRMWIPSEDRLTSVDLWTSGYLIGGRNNFDAASARALVSTYVHQSFGILTVHASAEKLVNPDPDVRALATFDPTIALIPEAYRLSENAFATEVGESHRLRSVGRAADVDGALFVAGSLRTASALSQHDHFGVAALGAGLRLIPGGQGSGTLRIDLLVPVAGSRGARTRPTLAVSVAPWLQNNRQREDPRLRQ